jgi:hypothetical protein
MTRCGGLALLMRLCQLADRLTQAGALIQV